MQKQESRAIDRILEFVDWLIENKLIKSVSAFERICGLNFKYLYAVKIRQRGWVSTDIVARIYEVFPQLSLEWVVTGKKSMFRRTPDDAMKWQIALSIINHATSRNLPTPLESDTEEDECEG